MGYFKLIYQDYPIEVPATESRLTLWAACGSRQWRSLDEFATLVLEARSTKFFFNPSGDPEDDVSAWLNPYLNTEWFQIPMERFQDRDYRSLEKIRVDFQGEGTPNALTGEDWWEAPGLISTYSDEWFTRAEISFRHEGGGVFSVRLTGEALFGTTFDIGFSAPLTVKLTAFQNSASADELLNWFDSYLRKEDFAFTERRQGEDLHVLGVAK